MKIQKISKLLCLVFVFIFLFAAASINISANIDSINKISPYLSDILSKTDNETKIPVFIWLDEIDLSTAFDKAYQLSDADIDKNLSNRRNNVKDMYEKRNTSLANEILNNDEIIYVSKYTPSILAKISKDKIYKLINYTYIKNIDYYDSAIAPQTGDSTIIFAILAVVATSGAVVLRKKQCNSRFREFMGFCLYRITQS